MKTLYLMRHAKASKEMDKYSDIERPLTNQGVEDVKRIGKLLNQQNLQIRNIVSSPALRTKESSYVLAKELGLTENHIHINEELYEADLTSMEESVYTLPDEWDHALLVGHNPSISQFAASLVTIQESMPTCGFIAIGLNIDKWTDLKTVTPVLKLNLTP